MALAHFPSITAADLNHAAAFLGLYISREEYALDVKTALMQLIRLQVRAMQAEALDQDDVATAVHPVLVELADRAERDGPEPE